MFYLIVQAEGFSSLPLGWTDVMEMDVATFLELIDRLSLRREQEAAEYEKARARQGGSPPA